MLLVAIHPKTLKTVFSRKEITFSRLPSYRTRQGRGTVIFCYGLFKNVMIVRICFYGAWDFLDDDVGRVVGKVTAGRDGDWPVGCCFCRQLPINNLARMCTSQQSRKRVIASYNAGKG